MDEVSLKLLASIRFDATQGTITSNTRQPALSLDEIRLQAGVLAFRKVLVNLILRETSGKGTSNKGEDESGDVQELDDSTRQPNVDEISSRPQFDDLQEPRAVLTLFANASGPRQLFSSLQRPIRVNAKRQISHLDTSVHVSLPLDATNLPHIISTTEIAPVHTGSKTKSHSKDVVRTLKDVFAPPANITPLHPPKPAKSSSTRSTNVSWLPNERPPQRDRTSVQTYLTQNLSTGQWLGYGGVDLPREPFSSEAKRKQRDRALSTGELNLSPTQDALAAIEEARADALFRSAYSSFAPNHDDSMAIVPEKVKSQVWWHKVNEKHQNESFVLDPALERADGAHISNGVAEKSTGEEDGFKEAVENYDPISVDEIIESSASSKTDRDTQDMLDEVSNLLETLCSYQRIRNSSITSAIRPPIAQSTSASTTTGNVAEPSEPEIDVYQMLKTQLSLLISTLPPYAVAKLNGDQMGELGISRKILIETKDYKGVMEEAQPSRLPKPANAPATAARSTHGQSAAPHTATASHYRPSSAARQNHVAQSYYPQQQPPARTPAMNHQRHTGYAQSYHTPNAMAKSMYRPPQNNYEHNAVKLPQQQNYSHINSVQQYQQRPAQGYGYSPHQYHPQTAVAQNRSYPQTSNPASAVRPPMPNASYAYTPQANTYGVNSPVPMKAPLSQQQPSQPQPYPQQYGNMRASYTAQTPANRSQYFTPNGIQTGYTPHTMKPATPSSLGPSGFHTSMTTEQQQLMMDRQRAQLGIQAQTQAPIPAQVQTQAQMHSQVGTHAAAAMMAPSTPTPQPLMQQQQQQQQQQAQSQYHPPNVNASASRSVQMMNGHPEGQMGGGTTVV